MAQGAASLLTLPCELRNVIYGYLFPLDRIQQAMPTLEAPPNTLAVALNITPTSRTNAALLPSERACNRLSILQTCHQIHDEAHLLALSNTPFHISGDCSYPDFFSWRSRELSLKKISAIRHLTLTAKIPHLRAMNEQWNGMPFGSTNLCLETLTIVPKRTDASYSAYAEVADLSQTHTLAYILAETLKTLKNVGVVVVRNDGCFKDVVWGVLYRSLVYRVWRWGGHSCGIRFEFDEERGNSFSAHLGADMTGGQECGDEVLRLLGGSDWNT
ncbi:hypothetical protein K431DRAFT_228901 [Polychaeton citri CBS 116435]|uniref:F-box domain-containing protein n=1 Tax=Polychaeton citri CBS 116435 TaxID=1314669 RepID=A0A9P4Q2D4_9PEZI|nr:hypothetical protein K431DRAFT_228901 [Polychaeton citri CBS 116435]